MFSHISSTWRSGKDDDGEGNDAGNCHVIRYCAKDHLQVVGISVAKTMI